MKQTFTPGPWETSSNAKGQWDVCMEDAGDMIADLSGCDNQEANARLIAAAPTMYSYVATQAANGDTNALAILESINGRS